jgi:hypothetical protein
MGYNREYFDTLPSDGSMPCPDCGGTKTAPYPRCGCPIVFTLAGFPYTKHINKYHHVCKPTPEADHEAR